MKRLWRLRDVCDGSVGEDLDEVAAAVRLLAERARIVAEGAGALGVAAALGGRAGSGRVVCVVSGGNIDATNLVEILADRAIADVSKPPQSLHTPVTVSDTVTGV